MPEPSCPLRGRRLPPSSTQECGGARRPPPPALCLPALTPPPPAARKPALMASAPAARWNLSGGGRAPRERPAVSPAAAGRDAALPDAEMSKRRAAVSRRRAARLAPPTEQCGPGAVHGRPPLTPARALPLRLGPALPQTPPLRRYARSCRTGRETRGRACAAAACSLGEGTRGHVRAHPTGGGSGAGPSPRLRRRRRGGALPGGKGVLGGRKAKERKGR